MVYVVQEPQPRKMEGGGQRVIDIGAASRFGKFDVLLPPGDVVISSVPSVRKLRTKLKDFGDDDYLLLLGDPVAIGMAVAVAAEFNRGKVKVLRWMKRQNDYVVVEVDVSGRALCD